MERTLVILKPSCVQRGLIGKVIERFEQKGLKIVAMKMRQLNREEVAEHYSDNRGDPYLKSLIDSMLASPVVLIALEGYRAVSAVRNIVGDTNGRKADPGTIRGDFSMSIQENIVHASSSVIAAADELHRFFIDADFVEYTLPCEKYLYADEEIVAAK